MNYFSCIYCCHVTLLHCKYFVLLEQCSVFIYILSGLTLRQPTTEKSRVLLPYCCSWPARVHKLLLAAVYWGHCAPCLPTVKVEQLRHQWCNIWVFAPCVCTGQFHSSLEYKKKRGQQKVLHLHLLRKPSCCCTSWDGLYRAVFFSLLTVYSALSRWPFCLQ